MASHHFFFFSFFSNDTATTEIYTLSLHDALPICCRSAVIGTVAILTSPLFVFLARQAVPDPVFVGLLEGAMACLMIVLFEDEEPRDGWAAAFYCFVGFATLSKGLLGFALPGAVAFFYCLVT